MQIWNLKILLYHLKTDPNVVLIDDGQKDIFYKIIPLTF